MIERALAAIIALTALGCGPLKNGHDVGAIPIAQAQANPVAMALSPDHSILFWANRGTNDAGFRDGSINQMTLPDGTVSIFAPNQVKPSAIVASGDWLYWVSAAEPPDGKIWKAPIRGGTPTPIASNQHTPVSIAVDSDGSVYWPTTGDGGLIWLLYFTAGSDPFDGYVTNDPQDGPSSMVVDDTGLYWLNSGNFIDDGTVQKRDRAQFAGASNQLATGLKDPHSLVVASGDLFWVNTATSSDEGSVVRLSFGSDRPSTLAARQNRPLAVAADGDDVFWTTSSHMPTRCSSPDGALRRISLSSGSRSELPTGGLFNPIAIVATRSSLYFSDLGCGSGGSSGSIYKFTL